MSLKDVQSAATALLAAAASAEYIVFEPILSTANFWDRLLGSATSFVSFVALFRFSSYAMNRMRFRDWYGDWFYQSAPDPKAEIRDGGFAWMNCYLDDAGELAYQVTRFRTYEALERAYSRRRDIFNIAPTFFRRVLAILSSNRLGSDRETFFSDVFASSESVRFNAESNSLVIFYHATYDGKPERRGRLTLHLPNGLNNDFARGEFRSIVAEGGTLKPSYGVLKVYRKLRDLKGEPHWEQ